MNEALIESREQLFFEARKIKSEAEADFYVYTFYGEVYIKKTPTSDPVKINCIADVRALLANQEDNQDNQE